MTDGQTGMLLLDLALIVFLAHLSGRMARRLGQPQVIGEILVGIILGPTLLHGQISRVLFPATIRPVLSAVADIGLVVFMFLVGTELNHRMIRGAGRITLGAVLGSTLIPVVMGSLLAVYLASHDKTANRVGFVLFMGVAMSVTAFPVLARIIEDRHLGRTPLGAIALSAAAACDVAAWTMLAVVQAVVDRTGPWKLLILLPYLAAMFWGVRPLLRRLLRAHDGTSAIPPGPLVLVLVGMLLSAGATQLAGLHFIFGAFLFGLAMPRTASAGLTRAIVHYMQFGTLILLPVYFLMAGLQVNLAGIGRTGLAQLGLIVVVAVVSKFGGAFLGVRTQGLPTRSSAVLATLMNARGLTELVVLSVGLRLGVLSGEMYTLLVVMAVVTTIMTGPALRMLLVPDMVVLPDEPGQRKVDASPAA